MVQVLGSPHLVLADIRYIHGLGAGLLTDLVDDLVGFQLGEAVLRVVVIALPFTDLLHPDLMFGLFDIRQDGLQDIGSIACQCQIHIHILAQFTGVNIDLDDFCLASKLIRVQRHTVREAGADGNDQISFRNSLVGGIAAVHSQHTQVVRLAITQHAGGHQGVGGGHTGLFQQVTQGLAARRTAHAAAKVDDRAFRFIDEPCGFLDLFLIIAGHGSDQLRLFVGELAGVRGDILGNIHQHGALTAGLCNAEGCPHGVGQVFDLAHGEVVLGDGHRDALNVSFLEAVPAQQAGGNVSGKGNHRHAVHISGGDAGDQIGGTRAAGGQHHTGAARCAGVTVCRMGSALLVGGQDMADAVRVFI